MLASNKAVLKAWIAGMPAQAKHLSTDGRTIWSYTIPIARRLDTTFALDTRCYSNTTTIHTTLARRAALGAGLTLDPAPLTEAPSLTIGPTVLDRYGASSGSCLLIDPIARTISTIDLGQTIALHSLKAALQCDYVEHITLLARVGLNPGISLWVNEEGLLHVTDATRFWTPSHPQTLIAGRGVVTALNSNGDAVSLPRSFRHPREHFATWLGNAAQVNATIEAGQLQRPRTTIFAGDGPPQTVWEWYPPKQPV